MIKVNNVSKSFGTHIVLSDVSLVVNGLAGIVGANGSGKTTLLNVIGGRERADAGTVEVATGLRLGYLHQGYADVRDRRVSDVFVMSFMAASAGEGLESIGRRMASEADPDRQAALGARYSTLVAEMEAAPAQAEVDDLRRALSLREVAPDERVGQLSGGEQSKLGLIELVVSRPNGLLLDEPTNNLDLPALEWLDEYLAGFDGPALIVSHDRALLDRHVGTIFEIEPESGMIERFSGHYAAYVEEKARREADTWARYRQQRLRERQARQEIRRIRSSAQYTETRTINDHYRRKAKKVARRASALERRLERQLEADDQVEKPASRPYRVKADMSPEQRSGDRMLAVRGVSVGVSQTVLLSDVDLEVGWGERVVLMGANGGGKTTLLRVIHGLLPLIAGSVATSPSVKIGYLPQEDEEGASGGTTPLEAIRAISPASETEARKFLHRFLFSGDDALTPVARLSYGERRRLALARLVLSGANLLLLDEPTNHLDIPSREPFELALGEYEGAMIAVTHDRYFIDRFADRALTIEDGRVVPVSAVAVR